MQPLLRQQNENLQLLPLEMSQQQHRLQSDFTQGQKHERNMNEIALLFSLCLILASRPSLKLNTTKTRAKIYCKI